MIEIKTLRDLRIFLEYEQHNYSNKQLMRIIESTLTVWFVNDYSRTQLLEKVRQLTNNLQQLPERPLFV